MRERSQGGLLSGKRESAKWLAVSCPECVHIELTQSSLLASGTLPVWNKNCEQTKLIFSPTPHFPFSAQKLEQWKREILLFFTVSGVVGCVFFNDKRHLVLSNARHGGAVSDRPAGGQISETFPSLAYEKVSLLSLQCFRAGRPP